MQFFASQCMKVNAGNDMRACVSQLVELHHHAGVSNIRQIGTGECIPLAVGVEIQHRSWAHFHPPSDDWVAMFGAGYSTIRWLGSNERRDAYRCLHPECWTASRWLLFLDELLPPVRRRRHRCIQTHSDGICQTLDPARMMNIPPRSTVPCLFWPKNKSTSCILCQALSQIPPSPPIDSIWAMMIVWM